MQQRRGPKLGQLVSCNSEGLFGDDRCMQQWSWELSGSIPTLYFTRTSFVCPSKCNTQYRLIARTHTNTHTHTAAAGQPGRGPAGAPRHAVRCSGPHAPLPGSKVHCSNQEQVAAADLMRLFQDPRFTASTKDG
eukprot:1144555-Pelagomonas_calceolata.AAC.8